MSIITLITDFGNKDHFVAKIKGDIYSNYNEAKIVDVSNNVSPFNIMEAAYILENSYKSFPEKTVHIIDVDSEKTAEKKHIIVYLDNHFFISADNGILSILSQNINPEKIYEINIDEEKQASILKANDLIIIGTEKEVLDKLINFIDIVGPFGTLLLTGHDHYGWKELWSNTLVQMSENIRPKLDNYIRNLKTLTAAE